VEGPFSTGQQIEGRMGSSSPILSEPWLEDVCVAALRGYEYENELQKQNYHQQDGSTMETRDGAATPSSDSTKASADPLRPSTRKQSAGTMTERTPPPLTNKRRDQRNQSKSTQSQSQSEDSHEQKQRRGKRSKTPTRHSNKKSELLSAESSSPSPPQPGIEKVSDRQNSHRTSGKPATLDHQRRGKRTKSPVRFWKPKIQRVSNNLLRRQQWKRNITCSKTVQVLATSWGKNAASQGKDDKLCPSCPLYMTVYDGYFQITVFLSNEILANLDTEVILPGGLVTLHQWTLSATLFCAGIHYSHILNVQSTQSVSSIPSSICILLLGSIVPVTETSPKSSTSPILDVNDSLHVKRALQDMLEKEKDEITDLHWILCQALAKVYRICHMSFTPSGSPFSSQELSTLLTLPDRSGIMPSICAELEKEAPQASVLTPSAADEASRRQQEPDTSSSSRILDAVQRSIDRDTENLMYLASPDSTVPLLPSPNDNNNSTSSSSEYDEDETQLETQAPPRQLLAHFRLAENEEKDDEPPGSTTRPQVESSPRASLEKPTAQRKDAAVALEQAKGPELKLDEVVRVNNPSTITTADIVAAASVALQQGVSDEGRVIDTSTTTAAVAAAAAPSGREEEDESDTHYYSPMSRRRRRRRTHRASPSPEMKTHSPEYYDDDRKMPAKPVIDANVNFDQHDGKGDRAVKSQMADAGSKADNKKPQNELCEATDHGSSQESGQGTHESSRSPSKSLGQPSWVGAMTTVTAAATSVTEKLKAVMKEVSVVQAREENNRQSFRRPRSLRRLILTERDPAQYSHEPPRERRFRSLRRYVMPANSSERASDVSRPKRRRLRPRHEFTLETSPDAASRIVEKIKDPEKRITNP
jgi:hypothetical protein